MTNDLAVRNRQRAIRLDLRRIRQATRHLLEQELGVAGYELGVHFVSERRITALNRQFLQHEGATDVITFDHRETPAPAPGRASDRAHPPEQPGPRQSSGPASSRAGLNAGAATLHGELFICPAVARNQAKAFRTSPGEELVRYIVHGILHLQGFDDCAPRPRSIMKREEARLLRRLARRFALSRLADAPKVCA